MESYLEKGEYCSKERLERLHYKYEHGVGNFEVWSFTKEGESVTWLLRDSSKIVKDIIINVINHN
jgi:hypothetical protein